MIVSNSATKNLVPLAPRLPSAEHQPHLHPTPEPHSKNGATTKHAISRSHVTGDLSHVNYGDQSCRLPRCSESSKTRDTSNSGHLQTPTFANNVDTSQSQTITGQRHGPNHHVLPRQDIPPLAMKRNASWLDAMPTVLEGVGENCMTQSDATVVSTQSHETNSMSGKVHSSSNTSTDAGFGRGVYYHDPNFIAPWPVLLEQQVWPGKFSVSPAAGGITERSKVAAPAGHHKSFQRAQLGAALSCPPSLRCVPGVPRPPAQYMVTCNKGSKKLKIVTSYPTPNPPGPQSITSTRYCVPAPLQAPAASMLTYAQPRSTPVASSFVNSDANNLPSAMFKDSFQLQASRGSAFTNSINLVPLTHSASQEDLMSTNSHPPPRATTSTTPTTIEDALAIAAKIAAERTAPTPSAAAATFRNSQTRNACNDSSATITPAWSSASRYTPEGENATSLQASSSPTHHCNKNALEAPSDEYSCEKEIRSPSPVWSGACANATLNSNGVDHYNFTSENTSGHLWDELKCIDTFEWQPHN
jgi:hypothetical protein